MADAAILNCQNRKMLLAIMVHRAKTHHSAEFSIKKISPSVVQILQFFDYSRWRPQPSWTFKIVKILLADRVHRAETHHVVPHVVEIGQSIVKI